MKGFCITLKFINSRKYIWIHMPIVIKMYFFNQLYNFRWIRKEKGKAVMLEYKKNGKHVL